MENQSRLAKIVVIGSINMDLVAKLDRSPIAGETILGSEFSMISGGKGANQAVAAARLGAEVVMVGCVGDDVFGSRLREQLDNEGIDTRHVRTMADQSTGVALIQVQREGENSIIVIPGANGSLKPEYVDAAELEIRSADIMLLQLEIPLEAVERAVELAFQHGVRIILNPAPAPTAGLPESLLCKLDMLTPNETEAAILSTGTAVYEGDIHGLVDNLKQRTHVANLIVTHGDKGVYYDLDGTRGMQAACKVEAVDTTAAGDCFNAAVAVRWAEGAPLTEAIQFAIWAAALSVSRFGAQTSLPMRSEVEGWVD